MRGNRNSPLVSKLLAETSLRAISCRLWRTDAEWSIPLRTLPDTLLFIPLHGCLVAELRQRIWPLGPGQLLAVADQEPHRVTYAPGTRSLEVLAVHLHLTWRDGTPVAAGFGEAVGPLPDATRWHQDLQDLATLTPDPELFAAYGRLVLHRLFADLLLHGWDCQPPAIPSDSRLAAVVTAMRSDPGAGHTIADLAALAGLSPVRFRLLFRRELGISPKVFLDRLRLAQAAHLLREGLPVADCARRAGFAAPRQLQARFRMAYGVTPAQWRRDGGEGP